MIIIITFGFIKLTCRSKIFFIDVKMDLDNPIQIPGSVVKTTRALRLLQM